MAQRSVCRKAVSKSVPVISAGVLLLLWNVAARGGARPAVDITLSSGRVYAGERPTVRITITAEGEQAEAVQVVKQASAFDIGSVDVRLKIDYGVGILRFPGAAHYLGGLRKPKAEDFEQLPAGKSVIQNYPVLTVPNNPGEYIVEVTCRPTADPGYVVEKELLLRCCAIETAAIRDAARLSHDVRWMPSKVELLNVVTPAGARLIYRELSSCGEVPQLRQICSLDEDSKIAAVGKLFDQTHHKSQVWVVFNRQAQLHFLRIDCTTGEVLASKVIGQDALAEPGPPQQK